MTIISNEEIFIWKERKKQYFLSAFLNIDRLENNRINSNVLLINLLVIQLITKTISLLLDASGLTICVCAAEVDLFFQKKMNFQCCPVPLCKIDSMFWFVLPFVPTSGQHLQPEITSKTNNRIHNFNHEFFEFLFYIQNNSSWVSEVV